MVVHPSSGRISRVRPYLRMLCGYGDIFRIRGCNPLKHAFPGVSPICSFFRGSSKNPEKHLVTPSATTWILACRRFGLFPFRSSLLGESLVWFLFLSYWDISVRKVSFHIGYTRFTRVGFPIRKPGSIAPRNGSSRLIAVLRVLRRMYESRHPLYAFLYADEFWNI